MKLFLLLLTNLFFTVFSFAQNNHTISGFIKDASTGEPLIGANIYSITENKGTSTNAYGFYSLTCYKTDQIIQFSYIGYQSDTLEVTVSGNITHDLALEPSYRLGIIEVTSTATRDADLRTTFNYARLDQKKILEMPAILGEADILKVLQAEPGVQGGQEGQSGLHVRGGSPDQNLILLDDVPVYNASHLFGFLSVFNSDAIKEAQLYKGGFPARYGGRISSVLDIRMKEGNNKEWKFNTSASTLSANFLVEGPLIKNKTSILLSGRRSFLDLIAQDYLKNQILGKDVEGGVDFFFYDFNLKLNHIINRKNRIYISAYSGKDNFYTTRQTADAAMSGSSGQGVDWNNFTASVRWNRQWGNRLFSNLTIYNSRYQYRQLEEQNVDIFLAPERGEINILQSTNGINNLALRYDWDLAFNTDHYLKFGGGAGHYNFNPGTVQFQKQVFSPERDSLLRNIDTIYQQIRIDAQEIYLYADYESILSKGLKSNIGIHTASYLTSGNAYLSVQPRININYQSPSDWTVGTTFSVMEQYLHLLSNPGAGLPSDRWLTSTERVKPERSWQSTLGVRKKFEKSLILSVEGFYKKMTGVIEYRNGANLFLLDTWENQVVQGEGNSFGLEFLLQKQTKRFSTNLSYTLSKTNRVFDEINGGESFPYRYDRRHNANIQAHYEILPDKLDIAANWIYQTGYAITIPLQKYIVGDDLINPGVFLPIPVFSQRNAFRLSDYHRMDLSLNYTVTKKRLKTTLSLGGYNIYNRKNPYFWDISTSVINIEPTIIQTSLAKTSLLGFIPFINLRIQN